MDVHDRVVETLPVGLNPFLRAKTNWVSHKQQNLFLSVLKARKFKIELPGDWLPGLSLLFGS